MNVVAYTEDGSQAQTERVEVPRCTARVIAALSTSIVQSQTT